MTSAFSIIIPAFDAAPYVGRALASAVVAAGCAASASGAAAEIVVVDDRSTDGTAAVARAFAAAAPVPVRVLEQAANGGAGPARNAGVRAARGDVLFFLDADDVYAPSHVALCLDALSRVPRAAFVRTGVVLDEEPHPGRRAEIESTIPSALAIRRPAFAFLGGFGEGAAFRRISMEDSWLATLAMLRFNQARVKARTVTWRRRPGNHRDRLDGVWHRPVDQEAERAGMAPEDLALLREIDASLAAAWEALRRRPPLSAELASWFRVDGQPNKFIVGRRRR